MTGPRTNNKNTKKKMDQTLIISIGTIFGCLLALSWFAGSDAPYVPTKMAKIKKILKLAGVKKGKVFYELGSGDGRVVLEAAKLGAESYGIEQSWIRVWYSRIKSHQLKIENAVFFHGNVFDRHYYPSDVVYIYLLPQAVEKLEEKLKTELSKGDLIITQKFHFKNWKPFKKVALITPDDKIGGDFWLYRKT